jgi:hypothetical protein
MRSGRPKQLCRHSVGLLLGVCLLLGATIQARADGKVFPTAMAAGEVRMPDQRALLCWSDNSQRLVIETGFEGDGTDFAWVIPLPSVPVIEAATPGLFPTLEQLFRPVFRHDVLPVWRFVWMAAGLLWLVATVRATGSIHWHDLLACLVVVIALSVNARWLLPAGVIGLVLLSCVQVARAGRMRFSVALAWSSGASLLLVGVLLLPARALSKAGAAGSGPYPGVEVLSRELVGIYEIEVVTTHDPDALPGWLQGHGYSVDDQARRVIELYVDRGWVFVAARLQRHLESGINVPHPLSFTFRSEKPVYPLRLTGVGGHPLELELYVFGPGRATVPGLAVKDCLLAQYGEGEVSWRHRVRPGMIRHATLAEWTYGLPVVTRLRGTLTSQQMSDDAEVLWRRFREVRDVQYSGQGAWTTGLNWGTYVGMGIYLALAVLAWGGWRMAWLARIGPIVALGLALLVSGVSWWMLPTVPVRFERLPGISLRNTLYHAYVEAILLAEDQPELELSELRLALAERLATANADKRSSVTFTNLFTGQPVRDEDSPGNYVLRQRDDQFEFVAFDPEGAAVVLGSFRTATEPEP